ncbi:MAG: YcnI family protein [Rhodospirillaceae bacterium]
MFSLIREDQYSFEQARTRATGENAMKLKNRLMTTLGGAVLCAGLSMGAAGTASAHNVLNVSEAPAGYLFPMVLNVNHGCKAAPVTAARLQIPNGIVDAKAVDKVGWKIEYKMRDLETPVMMHGREVTEVIGEIVWTKMGDPVPSDGWASFEFRGTIPKDVGRVMHFKNITVCEGGKTDAYVDMPEQALDVNDPEFAKKAWAFMTATSGPAPMVVIREPAKGQYPWEWTPEQIRGEEPSQEAMAR